MLRNIVNMVMQGSHITHEVGITHLKIKRGDEKGMDDQKQLSADKGFILPMETAVIGTVGCDCYKLGLH